MFKRIIPCLDIKNGNVVKGKKFKNISILGNIFKLSEKYYNEGADEIILLNISKENINIFSKIVKKVSKKVFVPITVGGNIQKIEDVKKLFNCGADKICLNSTLYYNPNLVSEIKFLYGSQCIVASIDVKKNCKKWKVYVNGGKTDTGFFLKKWIIKNEKKGIGEILLTSIDKDGKKKGYDYKLYKSITKITNIPVIASGGAGKAKDFIKLFKKTKINAALAASVFHKNKIIIKKLKKKLFLNKIKIRK